MAAACGRFSVVDWESHIPQIIQLPFSEFAKHFPSFGEGFNGIIKYCWTPSKKTVTIEIDTKPIADWSDRKHFIQDFSFYFTFNWSQWSSASDWFVKEGVFLNRPSRNELLLFLSRFIEIHELFPIGTKKSQYFQLLWKKTFDKYERELFFTKIAYPQLVEHMKKVQKETAAVAVPEDWEAKKFI